MDMDSRTILTVTDKIKELRKIINATGRHIELEVDGGVNLQNVSEIIEAGADVIVAGSAVFKGDVALNVKKFKEIFAKYE